MAGRHTGPWPMRNDERSVAAWLVAWIGGDEAHAVVRLLLEHVTGMDRGRRLMGHAYTESQLNELAQLAKACIAGTPVQHAIGATDFHGLRLRIDGRALVPRPETEELVERVLKWGRQHGAVRFCDAGTGSGCIALALKAAMPHAEVHAIDASLSALELARANGSELQLSVHWHHLRFDRLGELDGRPFDALVSNPPYIPQSECEAMDAVVVDHDPHEALFVHDDDPLIHYRTIALAAMEGNVLRPGGLLAFEVHEGFAAKVAELLSGWEAVTVIQDLQGKARMVTAQCPASR